MTKQNMNSQEDLSPEAILARAAAARGDIFPEWKPIAYALPQTYDLINKTGSYLHQYHGQSAEEQALSGPMRELIAIPALCAKGDMRHSPNHIRRIYRMGVTNKVILRRAALSAPGRLSSDVSSRSALLERTPNYPYGKRPKAESRRRSTLPRAEIGRKRKTRKRSC